MGMASLSGLWAQPGGVRCESTARDGTPCNSAPANGRRVVIKGSEHDDLVMCTHDKTYALKYVETTNTLLLLPPDQEGDQAFAALPSQTQGAASCFDCPPPPGPRAAPRPALHLGLPSRT